MVMWLWWPHSLSFKTVFRIAFLPISLLFHLQFCEPLWRPSAMWQSWEPKAKSINWGGWGGGLWIIGHFNALQADPELVPKRIHGKASPQRLLH